MHVTNPYGVVCLTNTRKAADKICNLLLKPWKWVRWCERTCHETLWHNSLIRTRRNANKIIWQGNWCNHFWGKPKNSLWKKLWHVAAKDFAMKNFEARGCLQNDKAMKHVLVSVGNVSRQGAVQGLTWHVLLHPAVCHADHRLRAGQSSTAILLDFVRKYLFHATMLADHWHFSPLLLLRLPCKKPSKNSKNSWISDSYLPKRRTVSRTKYPSASFCTLLPLGPAQRPVR